MNVREWLQKSSEEIGRLHLRAKFTRTGCKLADPDPVIGELIELAWDGTGTIDSNIKEDDLSWYARYFMGLGKEVEIEKPQRLIQLLRKIAEEVLEMYTPDKRRIQEQNY